MLRSHICHPPHWLERAVCCAIQSLLDSRVGWRDSVGQQIEDVERFVGEAPVDYQGFVKICYAIRAWTEGCNSMKLSNGVGEPPGITGRWKFQCKPHRFVEYPWWHVVDQLLFPANRWTLGDIKSTDFPCYWYPPGKSWISSLPKVMLILGGRYIWESHLFQQISHFACGFHCDDQMNDSEIHQLRNISLLVFCWKVWQLDEHWFVDIRFTVQILCSIFR